MRGQVILIAVIVTSCQETSQAYREAMRAVRAEAQAVEWLSALNRAEARFESSTRRYGSLPDLDMPSAPAWYATDFKLASGTEYAAAGYIATLRPTGRPGNGYFTDQSTIIRRCPPGDEPRVPCPATDPDPALIAQGRTPV
jgi:hypothetical protein